MDNSSYPLSKNDTSLKADMSHSSMTNVTLGDIARGNVTPEKYPLNQQNVY